jgi:hypothetical protein
MDEQVGTAPRHRERERGGEDRRAGASPRRDEESHQQDRRHGGERCVARRERRQGGREESARRAGPVDGELDEAARGPRRQLADHQDGDRPSTPGAPEHQAGDRDDQPGEREPSERVEDAFRDGRHRGTAHRRHVVGHA